MGKIRGTHSSPGIYTQVTDLSYAAKTKGITVLGLVGETQKGPAGEPIAISNWNEFVDVFGGTNPEKFKDSQYPKYELPYVAKSYLTASDKLYVCRVLGLSGYKAGSAFVISGKGKADNSGNTKEYVVAVLRSRGKYVKYANIGDDCKPVSKYDTLVFDCDEVELQPYSDYSVTRFCESGETTTIPSGISGDFNVNPLNYGRFNIVCKKENKVVGTYAVSLNPGAKDYIYNVLGGTPSDGDKAVFVEELYDVMLADYIYSGKIVSISNTVSRFNELQINAVAEPVANFVSIPAANLRKRNLGQTFVYAEDYIDDTIIAADNAYIYHKLISGVTVSKETAEMEEGCVYRVKSWTTEDGIKKYVYVPVVDTDNGAMTEAKVGKVQEAVSGGSVDTVDGVYNLAYDAFVALNDEGKITFLSDMCDYHEAFRCASTPWIVSEVKGNATKAEVKKLFRFHTITDGNEANKQVKISIANIRPDEKTFDVYVRDFNDSDANPTFLETYKNVTMEPGNRNYIGLKIGTLDGSYELRSKYVMVEIIENEMTKDCVPCGFLGYPVRDYSSKGLEAPTFEYNLYYDEDIKDKRQYFGLSDLKGVDVDMLNYKGKNAYTDEYTVGYTSPFHLDSTLNTVVREGIGISITVDGDESTEGLEWAAVSPNNMIDGEEKAPIIGTEQQMEGTIYENVKLRKFTVYPYGGFDGWDIYRNARTNTDEFKANKYKGQIINGHGETFSKITNVQSLALTGNCITSDYYAYLSAINQFENPEKYEFNLFATPGIDYLNQALLSEDAIDMIENRADSVYVLTTPDKPWGAKDEAIEDMYSSSDAASNLEDTNVNTFYGVTYYPWVRYFDRENNIYLNLPPTKDVVRNMANTDNKRYPWIASAGVERGTVECAKLHFPAKLDDRDNVYDNRINPLMTFPEGVKIWGNKSLYICDETDPLNRINAVRLLIYMRKLISEAVIGLIFEPNDATLRQEFEGIIRPILSQIKADRGITNYELETSQTPEQMDAHEISAKLWVWPTPTLEYIEIEFVVAPQGVQFNIG